MVAEPINVCKGEKSHAIKAQYFKNGIANFITNGGHAATAVAEPIRVGALPRPNGELSTSQGKTGLYAVPSTKDKNVYEVKDGFITIKGKQYPIKLSDGFYIIRKLTVTECCRLQGMPNWWFLDKNGNKLVSNAQAYKGLGNGWQLDTVKYILNNALSKIPKNTPILLLSMYDGIGTGRRILEELGFKNVKYYAYEIDKYCIALTKYRYPDVIHKGDAFKVRNQGEIESII